ncbi:EAL domain-containing protein [Pleionea mediterranea]|uniref:PAS domain S-box-containing protein/diguanylate cyclase (GGDEF)-like protein n=1 Tax=Pleionea mediterranea TaxID=523701 RepID=A0A316FK19_9GAMM|nr:EAL domain-containing protein [Pleionea mediterranea]PWK48485.1 PAS domain S-box-containing protein/diguanylate cyclase (GGDEF)-like protein [Pleionea mediterranea]
MMSVIFRSLCVLLFSITVSAKHQPSHSTPYFKQLSQEQGLNSRWVKTLAQDPYGFIWVGSANGLQRYDSYRVIDIKGPDNIFEGSLVSDLFLDSSNRLWVANEKSAYSIDPGTLNIKEQLFEGDQFSQTTSHPVLQIKQDSNDTLWFARWDGIYYLEQGTQVAKAFKTPLTEIDFNNEGILSVAAFQQQIFIGTTRGLYVTDKKQQRLKKVRFAELNHPALNDAAVRDIAVIQQHIWIATEQGLFQLSIDALIDNQITRTPVLVPAISYSFRQFNNETWVATADGVYKINHSTQHLSKVFNLNNGNFVSQNNAVYSLLFDQQGYLWMGTSGNGVFQWDPQSLSVTSYLRNQQDSSRYGQFSNIWSIYADENNTWVGTENGLFKFNRDFELINEYQITPEDWHHTERAVYKIVDVDYQLWLATYHGIRVFDSVSQKTAELPDKHKALKQLIKQRSYTALHKDNNNNLWIGHSDGVSVYSLETKKFLNDFTNTADQPFDKTVFFIQQDSFDDIWLASNKGLYRANTKDFTLKKIFQQTFKPDDPFLTASAIHRENQHELWVAYSGAGLYKLRVKDEGSEVIKHYSSKNGLPDSTLYSLYKHQGNFWIASHQGIIKFNTENNSFTQLTAFNGIAEEEFNQGAHTQLPSGELIFGSVNGLFKIQPKNIFRESKSAYPVTISQIQLIEPFQTHDYFIPSVETLTLDRSAIGFNVFITDQNYFSTKKTNFYYWIEGKTKRDPIATTQNMITLAGLPYGDHVLHIGVSGKPETANLSLPFTIAPPLWLTDAALVAYVLVLLLMTGLSLSFYFKYKQRKQQYTASYQANKKRLQLALTSSNSGLWDWSKFKHDEVYKRADYLDNFTAMSLSDHISKIHPDDKNLFIEKWSAFVQRKSNSFDCVYRLNHQGNFIWVHDLGEMTDVKKEVALHAMGTYTDITQSKNYQDSSNLYEQTFQNTNDAVAIIDQHLKIVSTNPTLLTLTGYKEKDLLNNSIEFLQTAQQPVDFFSQIISIIDEDEHWSGESWLRSQKTSNLPTYLKVGRTTSKDRRLYYFIWNDISALKQTGHKLKQLINYDALTQLPNRKLLIERIDHAIDKANHLKHSLAIILLDLDHFKSINDSLGHRSGDELLIEVSSRLKHCLHRDDTLARINGDEFVILLEKIAHEEQIDFLCQRLLEIMKQPFKLQNHTVIMTPSMGISQYPDNSRNTQQLLKHADMAMYHAKRNGRNTFNYFSEEMTLLADEQHTLEQELRAAVKSNELYPVFHPRYECKSKKVIGVEVLLRWRKSSGQHVEPDKFIPVAEKLNLILPITDKLLTDVCYLVEQHEEELQHLQFSINLSANHFLNYDLVGVIKNRLREHDINYSNIELEVTESTLMQNKSNSAQLLSELKDLGLKIAIDNFGSGYSSLNHFKDFDIDRLKIDRSFIRGIGIDGNTEAIIKTIIQLSKTIGVEVVAEGVENSEQLKFLEANNCSYFQGHLLSKPLNQNQLLKLIGNDNSSLNH